MYLIQILLPVYDDQGRPRLQETYAGIRDELIAKFGGLTAFMQSPAEGFWNPEGNHTSKDDIIMIEVMASEADREWWGHYRKRLEEKFTQESIVVRAIAIELF